MRLLDPTVELMLAGNDVELPTVPGAGHDAARQFAFDQRPALVGTDSVQSMEHARDIVQGNHLAGRHKLPRTAWRAIHLVVLDEPTTRTCLEKRN